MDLDHWPDWFATAMELSPEAHADVHVLSNAGLIARFRKRSMRREAILLSKSNKSTSVYTMAVQKAEQCMWMAVVIHRC